MSGTNASTRNSRIWTNGSNRIASFSWKGERWEGYCLIKECPDVSRHRNCEAGKSAAQDREHGIAKQSWESGGWANE